MKVSLCTLLLAALLLSSQSQSPTVIETDKIRGIICHGGGQWGYYYIPGRKPWTPTKEQIFEAEEKIESYLKERPSPQLLAKLSRDKRQYVGFIANGKKKIFCNFYCDETPLSCNPVNVDDGGDCYLQVIYNVERQKSELFQVNGR